MNDLYSLRNNIKCRMEEIERLKELAASLPSADPSKEFVSGGPIVHCKFAAVIDKIVDLESEVAAEINRYVDAERKVRAYINKIENPKHRAFMWYKYIDFLTMEQIAEKMDLSTRQIYNIQRETSLYFNDLCAILYTEEEAQ